MDNNDTNDINLQENVQEPVQAPVDNDADADEVPVDLTDEETIDLFVEGLMDEKGVTPESEELRKYMHADLKAKLLNEIDRSLIGELPDEKLEELSKKAETEGSLAPELVANAVSEAGLNVEDIVGVTMANFRDVYLGDDKPEGEISTAELNEAREKAVEKGYGPETLTDDAEKSALEALTEQNTGAEESAEA